MTLLPRILVVSALMATLPTAALAQRAAVRATDPVRVSPHETISGTLMNRYVVVTYGRPYSKDPNTGQIRTIWGGLVPWDAAWRAGSDEATTLTTPIDIEVGGATIPAGTYTLYMVPSMTGITQLAFSKNVSKWGIPVDTTTDLVRVPMTRTALPQRLDQFTMTFEAILPATLRLKMAWENNQYHVDFTAKAPAAPAAPTAPRGPRGQ